MTSERVVLVYSEADPDAPWSMGQPLMPPLGLPFLAGVLDHAGYDVALVDMSVRKWPLDDIVRNALAIGIWVGSISYQPAKRLATELRARTSAPLILGGPHVTAMPETCAWPEVDYLCVGEGEVSILEILARIRGGAVRDGAPRVVRSPLMSVDALDALPHPRVDLMPVDAYANGASEVSTLGVFPLNTSRGCPFDCSFCSVRSVWGPKYRTFSPEWVLDEIGLRRDVLHAKGLYFYEDHFTAQPKRVMAICDGMVERGWVMPWACEGRLDSISPGLLERMRAAGCECIKFGIESGSPRMLKVLNKELDLELAKRVRKMVRDAGIKFAAFMMWGLPGETPEDERLSAAFMAELQVDYLISNRFTPTPRSALYNQLVNDPSYHVDDNHFLRSSQ